MQQSLQEECDKFPSDLSYEDAGTLAYTQAVVLASQISHLCSLDQRDTEASTSDRGFSQTDGNQRGIQKLDCTREGTVL